MAGGSVGGARGSCGDKSCKQPISGQLNWPYKGGPTKALQPPTVTSTTSSTCVGEGAADNVENLNN